MNVSAARHNEKGNRYADRGKLKQARDQFQRAIKADPTWSVPHYNLGLIYKQQRNWSACLRANQKAVLLDPKDEAAWWNMGIAATALSNWREARKAWRGFGIHLPDGDSEPRLKLGNVPVRLNPKKAGEVVWAERIDPARAIIINLPLPQSGFHYRDLVLHDGEPRGFRKVGEVEVPVFDALELLHRSDFDTYEVTVETNVRADRQLLIDMAQDWQLGVEDWSTIRMLCQACSEGRPHDHHEPQEKDDGPLVRFGIAARDEEMVDDLMGVWKDRCPTAFVWDIERIYD